MTQEREARNWGMLCHISSFAGYLVPLGNIFGPLVIWLMKRDEIPLVDEQGKESLNFQISMTIYIIAAAVMSIFLIGIPILVGLVIAEIVLVIVAGVKVVNGEPFSYPLTIRFVQ